MADQNHGFIFPLMDLKGRHKHFSGHVEVRGHTIVVQG